MMRRAFYILAMLSALLCVAVVVLWVRSYWWSDGYIHYGDSKNASAWHVNSNDGVLFFGESSSSLSIIGVGGWQSLPAHQIDSGGFTFLAIGVEESSDRWGDYWGVTLHYFWLAYIFAGIPILWCFSFSRRLKRRRRLLRNHCIACGYDLQGSSGKCPECGAVRDSGGQLP